MRRPLVHIPTAAAPNALGGTGIGARALHSAGASED